MLVEARINKTFNEMEKPLANAKRFGNVLLLVHCSTMRQKEQLVDDERWRQNGVFELNYGIIWIG